MTLRDPVALAVPTWRERVGYVFSPLGWAADGKGRTSAVIMRARCRAP
jgi:hypothetical protein